MALIPTLYNSSHIPLRTAEDDSLFEMEDVSHAVPLEAFDQSLSLDMSSPLFPHVHFPLYSDPFAPLTSIDPTYTPSNSLATAPHPAFQVLRPLQTSASLQSFRVHHTSQDMASVSPRDINSMGIGLNNAISNASAYPLFKNYADQFIVSDEVLATMNGFEPIVEDETMHESKDSDQRAPRAPFKPIAIDIPSSYKSATHPLNSLNPLSPLNPSFSQSYQASQTLHALKIQSNQIELENFIHSQALLGNSFMDPQPSEYDQHPHPEHEKQHRRNQSSGHDAYPHPNMHGHQPQYSPYPLHYPPHLQPELQGIRLSDLTPQQRHMSEHTPYFASPNGTPKRQNYGHGGYVGMHHQNQGMGVFNGGGGYPVITSPIQPDTHTETPQGEFVCFCGKKYATLVSLKYHSKLHAPRERNFVCGTCEKGFLRKQDLKRHETTHLENYHPFLCERCGTTFTRSDALARVISY